MKLLVTGATGKVGQDFLTLFLRSEQFSGWNVVALCNKRVVEQSERVHIVRGSLGDAATIDLAMVGVTHVLHLAAVKESPDQVIDVSIKGMFLLLEAFRKSSTSQQFIMMSGDCTVGHIFHDYRDPITEQSTRKAYPGCYALAKVVEEAMLEQYQFQYDVNGCILRAPWIMEKDDFRYTLAFGPTQFGGPQWSSLLSQTEIDDYTTKKLMPVLLDSKGEALRRNFVHIEDVSSAILASLDNPKAHQKLFNISMSEPINYRHVAQHLKKTRGIDSIEIASPYHSNWLDNASARLNLDWSPTVTLESLIDKAWNYIRDDNDPRKIWYPG